MYYTGLNPDTMEEVFVPKSKEDKKMQRALLQYRKKENYDIVHKALELADRRDLIGFAPNCLIKPTKEEAIGNKRSIINTKKVGNFNGNKKPNGNQNFNCNNKTKNKKINKNK